jgi:hypothetical protein
MTLLTVVQDVCPVIGVTVPTSVLSGITTNRTMTEVLALATEMARRIAYETREWNKLKATATYAGNGVKTAFDLPADYQRMLLTANVWRSTSAQQPMRFVADTDEWLNRRARNMTDAWGEWTLLGGQIVIYPVMPIGTSAYHAYLHKNCIALGAGGVGDRFQADNDSFALSERVLTLGMIWQWKAQKGSAYNEDLGTYADALAMVQGADKPSPIIIGRRPISLATRASYPYPVPTP